MQSIWLSSRPTNWSHHRPIDPNALRPPSTCMAMMHPMNPQIGFYYTLLGPISLLKKVLEWYGKKIVNYIPLDPTVPLVSYTHYAKVYIGLVWIWGWTRRLYPKLSLSCIHVKEYIYSVWQWIPLIYTFRACLYGVVFFGVYRNHAKYKSKVIYN